MAEKKIETPKVEAKEKLVKITIPFIPDVAEDDVFVSVNERKWLIKRGEEVEVPECVVEVLDHQSDALKFARSFEMELENNRKNKE